MSEDHCSRLRDKMVAEISAHQPYEALVYVQTYSARKRHSLTQSQSWTLVWTGVLVLLENNEIEYGGTLFNWFLSSGMFYLDEEQSNLNNVLRTISCMTHDNALKFLDSIYSPLREFISHQKIAKLRKERCLYELSTCCAVVFERCGRWRSAKDCYFEIGDIEGVARVAHQWAQEGYISEYSLFFVRVYVYLLANRLLPQAAAFHRTACDEYMDSYEMTLATPPSTIQEKACVATYHIWQMCTIVADLLALADTPDICAKVDRAKIYSLTVDRFEPLLNQYDPSLLRAMREIGSRLFNLPRPVTQRQALSPMGALFDNFLSGMQG